MDHIKKSLTLLEQNKETNFKLPFPMGVFGTLRRGMGNNRRMHAGTILAHRLAFMPHFVARGLSIKFNKDSSAPFEIFFYEPDQWEKMIPGVDALEGFSPSHAKEYGDYGYYRTLAWLHLLPEKFNHQLFAEGLKVSTRDLGLDVATWKDFERIPCWVYSSIKENRECTKAGMDTVIWG